MLHFGFRVQSLHSACQAHRSTPKSYNAGPLLYRTGEFAIDKKCGWLLVLVLRECIWRLRLCVGLVKVVATRYLVKTQVRMNIQPIDVRLSVVVIKTWQHVLCTRRHTAHWTSYCFIHTYDMNILCHYKVSYTADETQTRTGGRWQTRYIENRNQ